MYTSVGGMMTVLANGDVSIVLGLKSYRQQRDSRTMTTKDPAYAGQAREHPFTLVRDITL